VLWQQRERLVGSGPMGEALRGASELLVSVVSFVEVGIKASTGKLTVPARFRETVLDSGVRLLGLTAEHGLGIGELPLHHRDPFDRLLISQARHEGLTILTADPHFARYDVAVVLAA
jgi:PIN domain nuclease of toxin-antitoxin system